MFNFKRVAVRFIVTWIHTFVGLPVIVGLGNATGQVSLPALTDAGQAALIALGPAVVAALHVLADQFTSLDTGV